MGHKHHHQHQHSHHHPHHYHHKKGHGFNFGSIIHEINGITKPIGHIIETSVKETGSVIRNGENQIASVGNNLINKSGSLLSSMELPIIIVGGLIAYYVITKKT
jgi:hypothetical protein